MGRANSVVRIGVGSSICPSSRRRFQTHCETICHASWEAGRMRAPAIGVLLLIFIGKHRSKGPTMQVEGHHIGGRECLLREMREKELVDNALAGVPDAALFL